MPEKKPVASIKVSVNPNTSATSIKSSTANAKVTKKIDMGAASNFGKNDLGINSPTHRNTHAEEDLFDNQTNNNIHNNNSIIKTDDLFKTCGTPSPTNIKIDNHSGAGDLDFNPREDESQEFGDFASAFGVHTKQPAPPSQASSLETKKDAFADFGSAFVSGVTSPNQNTNSTNLLFDTNPIGGGLSGSLFGVGIPSMPSLTIQQTPSTDLLSDFGGLSLNAPVFNGKFESIFSLSFPERFFACYA